ncbi:MAG: T9SS type A sorting domain-containing protein [Muribaculum sp.]|nr:T9SS type A sorting domain-containing protein [Muribaculum sp.]
MKKLTTLLFGVMCAFATNAQDFTCTVNGQTVEDGGTVTVGYTYGLDGAPFWVSKPAISLTSSEDLSCLIKTSCQPGTPVKFCYGVCKDASLENGFDVISYDFNLKANEAEKLDIEYEDFTAADESVVPEKSSVDVIVSVKLRQRFHFTIVFDGKATAAGIDNVADNGNFVNLAAGNILEYNVPAGTKLDVYSLNGATVIERTINGHGSLSLDRLAPGVYLYKAGELSGKVLVK